MFGYYRTNKIYLAQLGICTQGQYNRIKKPTNIYTFVKPTTNSDYRKNYLDVFNRNKYEVNSYYVQVGEILVYKLVPLYFSHKYMMKAELRKELQRIKEELIKMEKKENENMS